MTERERVLVDAMVERDAETVRAIFWRIATERVAEILGIDDQAGVH